MDACSTSHIHTFALPSSLARLMLRSDDKLSRFRAECLIKTMCTWDEWSDVNCNVLEGLDDQGKGGNALRSVGLGDPEIFLP